MIRTAEYREEDRRKDELREAAERGRQYKIAGAVFSSFLDERREEIVKELEGETFNRNVDMLRDYVSELKVMRKFRDVCRMQIDLGELAEKELDDYGAE